tara:strand:+ start:125 stop:454 length:330 start_codon:yes stop_codon:yes gene_type:complete
MEKHMKKLLLLFLSSLISISYANNLDDWTHEDLCRWLDSISIPEQILDEIDEREIICYVSYEANGLKAQIPSKYENGIVLPLSSSQTIRTVKPNRTIPILLRFNFKFTL